MAFSEESGNGMFTMPVAPFYGNGNSGNGFGNGDWAW